MSRVDDLGRRVKQLREFRNLKPRQMARVALGKDASDDDLTEWANSLGKLERGDEGHTNPGLPRIYSTAKGFGFDELSDFFEELERVPDLINQQGRKDLSLSAAKADNSPAHGDQVPAPDFSFLAGAIAGAAQELVSALDRVNTTLKSLLDRVDASAGQAPASHAAQTGGSARAAGGAGKGR